MASTAACKTLLDTDPSVAQFGGQGPWIRRSKKKASDGVERLFVNTAGTCFVRVLEDASGNLKVDRVGGTAEAVQPAARPSLFERFPPTAHEDRDWTGRVIFDLDTADGEELDDDEVAFYCGFEVRDEGSLCLNTDHSPATAAMIADLFASEAGEERLRVEEAESFHTIERAEGQSRAALTRRIRKALIEAGAIDACSPDYDNRVSGSRGKPGF